MRISTIGPAHCDSVLLHAALYWNLSYYIFVQWKIINSLSCSSHLLYGAASFLCSKFKEMYFNFTAYIFLYKYITCFHECILQQYKEQYIFFFTRFSPILIHFSLFPNNLFSLILNFIKLLCTHSFSRVTFSTELSTNLVYESNFVIDYNYISIHLLVFFTVKLFFFTVKLSIFSRLCVKHKRAMSMSSQVTFIYIALLTIQIVTIDTASTFIL